MTTTTKSGLRTHLMISVAAALAAGLCLFTTTWTSAGQPPRAARMLPQQAQHQKAASRQIDLATRMRGGSGAPAAEAARPFSPEDAVELARRIEALNSGASSSPVKDYDALNEAMKILPQFETNLQAAQVKALSAEETQALSQQRNELENLEGIAIKGRHRAGLYRPPSPVRMLQPPGSPADASTLTSKVNTGWILDQHLYDPAGISSFPTLNSDYRTYDEGQNDMAMGHSDHPTADSMFGWVWQVQTLYWTDIATVADHPNASNCIMVMVSPDGGASWWLYAILYDPQTSPAVSKDMINPKLAVDITGTGGGGPYDYDRLYIAYEYAYSATDHDVNVYGMTSVMDQAACPPTCNEDIQDISVAATANWEGNPAIASDYKTAETSYRVVAYEYAFSATDKDIRASQSTGNGSTWAAAVDVAATTANETRPAITAGATGNGGAVPFASYMHLVYNFDAAITGGNVVLADRGFEAGQAGTAWYKSCGTAHNLITTTSTHSGTYKATLGGYNSDHDVLSQLVTIPADAGAAALYFWLRITTAETTHPYDDLYVSVWDSTGPPGTWLADLAHYTDADAATYGSWTLVGPFDLSAYIGQTVRIGFEAFTDSALVTSFYLDDTELRIAASRVQYTQGAHSSGNYPSAMSTFSKKIVMSSYGSPTPWPYGAASVGASHGGGGTSSLAPGRLLVTADQLFPADAPTPGDPQRYQLMFSVNMCNGDTTCGNIAGCTPALSQNWNEYWFYDNRADYRYPAIVVDGVGWVQGTSPSPQNGVSEWPEMFMSYYHKPWSDPPTPSDGDAQLILTFADDESCEGFQAGSWFWFTALENASDGDGKVVAKPGTIVPFNYFYSWPGVCFNKRLNHMGTGINDDVFFTTLGDNYTIDTVNIIGGHIDSHFTYNSVSYMGAWTFAWPAGFQMLLTADREYLDGDRFYEFSIWDSNKDNSLDLLVNTAFYTPGGILCPYGPGLCQPTTLNAWYGGGCPPAASMPLVPGPVTGVKSASNAVLSWPVVGPPLDVRHYAIYRATDPTAAKNYNRIGTSPTNSYTDTTATLPAPVTYYYIVVTGCEGREGPWGHYGQ